VLTRQRTGRCRLYRRGGIIIPRTRIW
jgi:hypothetical protein